MAAKDNGGGRKRSQRPIRSPGTTQAPRGESTLTQERIIATAVALLDADGVERMTMRRLADRLGSGAMSLYWHVESKEKVFDLALDSVLEYRGPRHAAGPDDWRENVVHMIEDWRASMLRHPWSVTLLPRRALGPNILGRLELLGKTLSGAGVPDADLNIAIWSLWNYVMGATVTRASFALSAADKAAAQTDFGHLSAHYPTIEGSRLLLDDDWNGTFSRGLDFLLDGLVPGQ